MADYDKELNDILSEYLYGITKHLGKTPDAAVHARTQAKAKLNDLLRRVEVEARVEENQTYLDQINNYKPDPTAPSFGSASGVIATSGWKHAFEDRIAELKALKAKEGKD